MSRGSGEDRDAALMLRFQQDGDFQAFEALFRRHKDGLVHFISQLSGSRVIAEDVSQQIWVKIIEVAKRGAYRATAGFRTYLYTLGRNKYFDEYHRKHAQTRTSSLEDGETVADDSEAGEVQETIRRQQLSGALDKAIRELPSEQREVIGLWSLGFELQVVADIAGVPRNTVISRKKYAMKKLKSALQEMGISESQA